MSRRKAVIMDRTTYLHVGLQHQYCKKLNVISTSLSRRRRPSLLSSAFIYDFMAHPISHQSSTNAQKRQSLNLSTGPRPLQLVDSVRTSSPGPNSGSSSSPSARGQSLYSPAFVSPGSSSQGTTPITPAFSQKQARRQSSISYNPPPRESSLNSPTFSDSRHRPTLSHTTSLSRRTSYRNSQQLDGVVIAEEVLEQARPALTLVEKYVTTILNLTPHLTLFSETRICSIS